MTPFGGNKQTFDELRSEREYLLEEFEKRWEKVIGIFDEVFGVAAEVSFYADPLEKYSLLTETKSDIYSYSIVYGWQKIHREWQLTLSTEGGEPAPLEDAGLPLRLAFLSVYTDLLMEMAVRFRSDNKLIRETLGRME